MKPAIKAAVEINERWHRCLDGQKLHPEACPSNEQIAEIIERNFEDEPQRNQTEKKETHHD